VIASKVIKKLAPLFVAFLLVACMKHAGPPSTAAKPTAANAIVEVSGGKQAGSLGASLNDPVVVQVNDAQGNAVQDALVTVTASSGATASPPSGLTDSSGQFTSVVSAPGVSGHFQVTAATTAVRGKSVELKLDEIALGYEQVVGLQLSTKYCARCHDPESTPERVSNMDNLDPKPHAFSEGDFLNKISDADISLIISRGGAALNESGSMPPYGFTLGKSDVQALVSYIRAVADPPYRRSGTVYANK
jgi:mono/diheme cytochrome c family protein